MCVEERLTHIHLCLYFCACGRMCEKITHMSKDVCVLQVTAGLMLQQRRPDTPVLWARISLTCQIGGSVSLAAGPASHRKYFLSICELGTERLERVGGRKMRGIYWPEGERRDRGINYNIWSDWINIG